MQCLLFNGCIELYTDAFQLFILSSKNRKLMYSEKKDFRSATESEKKLYISLDV